MEENVKKTDENEKNERKRKKGLTVQIQLTQRTNGAMCSISLGDNGEKGLTVQILTECT